MKQINIGRMWFPVVTLGYGNRLGIWFQGCNKRCRNCISPELQIQEAGKKYTAKSIMDMVTEEQHPDGLTISGGEPFDQPEGLLELMIQFKQKFNDDILIFTGYTLEELHEKNSVAIEEILKHVAVLVDGRYEEDLNEGSGLRGSSNQKIYVWKHKERYENIEQAERKMQCVLLKDCLWMIGIPQK